MFFSFFVATIPIRSRWTGNLIGLNMKITEQKNGDYTTFERVSHNGYYIVKLYKNGGLVDKIMTDTYQAAREYLKCFNLIAKNG